VAELSAAHPDQADLIAAFRLRWPEMLGGALEGTVEILRELRRAGLRTLCPEQLVGGRDVPGHQAALFPFLGEMDGILISGEVRIGKPDPAIFREFAEPASAWSPRHWCYIDDHQPNVAACAALGMKAVRFLDSARLREDLPRHRLPLDTAAPQDANGSGPGALIRAEALLTAGAGTRAVGCWLRSRTRRARLPKDSLQKCSGAG